MITYQPGKDSEKLDALTRRSQDITAQDKAQQAQNQTVTTWVCGTNVLRNTGSQEQGIWRPLVLQNEGSQDPPPRQTTGGVSRVSSDQCTHGPVIH
jgi:hypothetical protein